jgi:hypothetical protein
MRWSAGIWKGRAPPSNTLAWCSEARHSKYARTPSLTLTSTAGNVEVSRALYYASTEIDMHDLGEAMLERLQAAVRGLLKNASGARFDALDAVVVSWVAIVTGGTRLIFEQDGTAAQLPSFREQLRHYLAAQNTARAI